MARLVSSPTSYYEFKSRGREAAQRFRSGSPKFKDLLRMRCRSRVKENRGKLVDLFRNLPSNKIDEVLFDTIRDEIMDIAESQPLIHDEMNLSVTDLGDMEEDIDEAKIQLLKHFETLLEEELLDGILAEPPAAWCPLCQRGALTYSPEQIFICTRCGVSLPSHGCTSTAKLGEVLTSTSRRHEEDCGAAPQFLLTAFEEGGHLLAVCAGCSTVDTLL